MAVARGGFERAVEAARLDVAVTGAQADTALGAFYGNGAVTGVDIQISRYRGGFYGAVSRVNLEAAVQGLRFHRAVSGVYLCVTGTGHAHFDMQVAGIVSPRDAPVAVDAGG